MRVNRVASIAVHDRRRYRFPDFSAPSIIIAGGRDVPHHTAAEAYPDIDPPPIMVGWINGQNGVGEVLTALSRDGGRTWSAPRPLRSADDTTRYLSITLFAEDQLSYAFLGTVHPDRSDAERVMLSACVTSDLGETWHDLEVDVGREGPSIAGGRLLSYCGHYLLPIHSGAGTSGTGDAVAFQSALLSEDLVHWRRGGVVPGSGESGLDDGHITHTQPGEHEEGLIMVMRESRGSVDGSERADGGEAADGHAWFALSEDCGESWSPADPYPEGPSRGARGFFATDSLGRYVTVFNSKLDRRALKCRVKEPHGPWGPVRDFPSPGEQNQNVDAVECAAGRYYCAFDTDLSTITFADVEF